jgi:transketolase N-terminal domain/subunit
MAIAGKLDKKSYRVFAALGDGELEEGQVWEAPWQQRTQTGQPHGLCGL